MNNEIEYFDKVDPKESDVIACIWFSGLIIVLLAITIFLK